MKGLQRDFMGKCRAYIAISRFNGKERANYCLGFRDSAGCPMMENGKEHGKRNGRWHSRDRGL